MNVAERGRVDADTARAIVNNAMVWLGRWRNTETIVTCDGHGLILTALPDGDYDVQVASNADLPTFQPKLRIVQ